MLVRDAVSTSFWWSRAVAEGGSFTARAKSSGVCHARY